jgi:hypothetical protein
MKFAQAEATRLHPRWSTADSKPYLKDHYMVSPSHTSSAHGSAPSRSTVLPPAGCGQVSPVYPTTEVHIASEIRGLWAFSWVHREWSGIDIVMCLFFFSRGTLSLLLSTWESKMRCASAVHNACWSLWSLGMHFNWNVRNGLDICYVPFLFSHQEFKHKLLVIWLYA